MFSNLDNESVEDANDNHDKDSNASRSGESWGVLNSDTDKALDVAWVRGKYIRIYD